MEVCFRKITWAAVFKEDPEEGWRTGAQVRSGLGRKAVAIETRKDVRPTQ